MSVLAETRSTQGFKYAPIENIPPANLNRQSVPNRTDSKLIPAWLYLMSQKLPCAQALVCIIMGTGDTSQLQHCQVIPTEVTPWDELLPAQSTQFPNEIFQNKLLVKRNIF